MDEPPAPYDRKKVFSWALYDWANSAFATSMVDEKKGQQIAEELQETM